MDIYGFAMKWTCIEGTRLDALVTSLELSRLELSYWPCPPRCARATLSIETIGNPWISIDFHRNQWKFIDIHGHPWMYGYP